MPNSIHRGPKTFVFSEANCTQVFPHEGGSENETIG